MKKNLVCDMVSDLIIKPPLFSLESFSFAFDSKAPLFFDHVSFQVTRQGLTFVQGKNGAGKSTFFRVLQGIVSRNEHVSGVLSVRGQSYNLGLLADRQRLHSRSMILHQSFDTMLAPSFTGFENLQFAKLGQNPGLNIVSPDLYVSDFALQFGIPLEKPVYQLSGGQRQMLAMLMITQKSLDLLLLDEPTAALDSKNSDYVMRGIEHLVQETGISVLCVSHDQDIVRSYAKSVIEIAQLQTGTRVFTVQ